MFRRERFDGTHRRRPRRGALRFPAPRGHEVHLQLCGPLSKRQRNTGPNFLDLSCCEAHVGLDSFRQRSSHMYAFCSTSRVAFVPPTQKRWPPGLDPRVERGVHDPAPAVAAVHRRAERDHRADDVRVEVAGARPMMAVHPVAKRAGVVLLLALPHACTGSRTMISPNGATLLAFSIGTAQSTGYIGS